MHEIKISSPVPASKPQPDQSTLSQLFASQWTFEGFSLVVAERLDAIGPGANQHTFLLCVLLIFWLFLRLVAGQIAAFLLIVFWAGSSLNALLNAAANLN